MIFFLFYNYIDIQGIILLYKLMAIRKINT